MRRKIFCKTRKRFFGILSYSERFFDAVLRKIFPARRIGFKFLNLKIMLMLHSSYGNMSAASEHAEFFPVRADMTFYGMSARIAHFEKDVKKELECLKNDFMCHIEALLDNLVNMSDCYSALGSRREAREALTAASELIELARNRGNKNPPIHLRERGNIYELTARLD